VIQYSTEASFDTFVTLPGVSASTTLTDLAAGMLYYIRVIAIGTGIYRNSDSSTVKSATTDGIKLDTPTFGNVTATSSSEISVAWADVAHADSYLVEYATNDLFTDIHTVSVTGTSTTLTGLTAGTVYYIRVTAIGTGTYSNSDSSPSKSIMTKIIPTLNDVLATGSSTIKVEWSLVANASNYVIQYSTEASFDTFVTLPGVSASTTSATITGLDAGTTYYIRIMVIGTGANGNSDYSAVKSAKTAAGPLAASSLDAFWNEYALNGIEDERFSLV
jgi:hypothetical protein